MGLLYITESIVRDWIYKSKWINMINFVGTVYLLYILIRNINWFSCFRMVGMNYRLNQCIYINIFKKGWFHSGKRNYNLSYNSRVKYSYVHISNFNYYWAWNFRIFRLNFHKGKLSVEFWQKMSLRHFNKKKDHVFQY